MLLPPSPNCQLNFKGVQAVELLVNAGLKGAQPFVSEVNRTTGKGNTRIVSVKESVQPPSFTETVTAWLPKVENPTVVLAMFGSGDTPVPQRR